MTETGGSTELAPRSETGLRLREFEEDLLGYLQRQGLPTDGILVPLDERGIVFANAASVLARLDDGSKQRSTYISKFLAAVASGLFDAALSYLWDETIQELRRRVSQYDLAYFYEAAVQSPEKRKHLKTEADLVRLDDSELVYGAHQIEVLSDIGFRHLDHIRYMRNWASAAHPNQVQLTGLDLLAWLQTCLREVVSLPISPVAAQINRLLANIKKNELTAEEAREMAATFLNLNQEQTNNLCNGFFGIYVHPDTDAPTRQNVRLLVPYLWDRVDEATRQQLGIRFGRFAANGDQAERTQARRFLEAVNGVAYIPDELRAAEVQAAIDNLLTAHRGWDNFHNEPPFARALARLVGEDGRVPRQVSTNYARALAEVFITNGNGVTWAADPIYDQLIRSFTPPQAWTALTSFTLPHIGNRLRWPLCEKKFRELLAILKTKVGAQAIVDLIEQIETYPPPLSKLPDDPHIRAAIANVQKIVGDR